MENNEEYPPVSIVVIGLNEANNLENTFSAINNINYPLDKIEVIYVDTGSTDGSIEIAKKKKKYADKVFIENSCWPTPGLARNRGLSEAQYDIVHFLDGDIKIDKDYLKHAVAKIQEPEIGAVYGYLEESSDSNLSNVLINHWKRKKSGYSNSTGGGGTYLRKPLLEVDGYDERIKRGEEIDLGERFKTAGYRIWLMNTIMGVHKYKITNMLHLLKRHFENGKAVGFNLLLPDKSRYLRKQAKNTKRWLLYFLIILILGSAITIYDIIHLFYFGGTLIILFHFYIFIKYFQIIKNKDKSYFIDVYVMNLSFPVKILGIFSSFFYIIFCKFKGIDLLKPKQKLQKLIEDL